MDSMPPISAAIICFNEERHIGACLEQLAWCNEVVVVDSGSTDRTVEIVRSFANTRVRVRPFDTFTNQKNFALDGCCNDWILSLDADEVLTEALLAEIQSLVFDVAGYKLPRRTFLGNHKISYGNWNPDYVLRLFRRSQCRWGGTNPHESVQVKGAVRKLKHELLHYSYQSREEYIERNKKYALMMVQHLRDKGVGSTQYQAYYHGVGNFFKAYILRRGFLDGADGLFLAWEGARASFIKHSELAALPARKAA